MAGERVVLVSMPWGQLDYPPIQLGILRAALEREGLGADVRSLELEFLDHCMAATAARGPTERIGLAAYDRVLEWSRDVGLGDWIFAVPPFRVPSSELDDQYLALLRRHPIPESDIATALAFRRQVPAFLEWCVEEIAAAAPAVVGFTTGANQSVASLTLAILLKRRLPSITIVLGGANCQGPMGAAVHRAFPWIDAVVRGEGERVFPALVKDRLAGNPVRPQPGLCYRDGDRPVAMEEAPGAVIMDEVPLPRYDEYFRRLARASFEPQLRPRVTLLYESARGCWWGERSHCTFCGISALAMPFRSKRPDLVVDELTALTTRYGTRNVLVVDYILDWRYFRDLLPRLRDAGQGLSLFCETKANLRKEQVRLLRDAGFVSIQAGIESLSDPILRSINKGVTAFQNIRLIKWCAELGVHLFWNVIYGLPGEPPDEYARMADVMRALVHLEPPRLVPLALERFSPYQQRPEAFGLVPAGPRRDYRFVYPMLDDGALAELAYSFDYRHADGRDPASYVRPLREVVEMWRAGRAAGFGSLHYHRARKGLVVTDRRPGLPAREYRFDEVETAVYLACEDGATFEDIDGALRAADLATVGRDDLQEFLEELTAARLVLHDGLRYLGLALRREDRRDGSARTAHR
jgi:ribosomal peptide maturation radical SAM protein 1